VRLQGVRLGCGGSRKLSECVVRSAMKLERVTGFLGVAVSQKIFKLIQSQQSCDFVEFLFHCPTFYRSTFFHHPLHSSQHPTENFLFLCSFLFVPNIFFDQLQTTRHLGSHISPVGALSLPFFLPSIVNQLGFSAMHTHLGSHISLHSVGALSLSFFLPLIVNQLGFSATQSILSCLVLASHCPTLDAHG
jgi:hypothetical protein